MDRRIERTRKAVVDATVDLVARRGSHVGMTEIAQAAGVSRKAVYENFGSREQVLLQATVNLLRAELSLKGASTTGNGDVLERLAHTVVEHMSEYREYYSAVLSGPGGYLAGNALVLQLASACRQRRNEHHQPSPASLYDRFMIHGLLGVLTEALVEHDSADLHAVVSRLYRELGASHKNS